MYNHYFSLKGAPFSIAPDPRYLFMSERHREALAHLLYGIGSGGGFVLLTGEIGAGKTTVCRCFIEQVPENCRLAYIFNPKLTVAELLQSVCEEFRIAVPAGQGGVKAYVDAINDYLLASHAQGRNNVLVIDEAQNLSAEVLEQLRLLTNLETSERKLLQIILIGQPELRTMLARPELEQLAQRVIARYHLGPLSEAETGAYIAHRMAVAGFQGGAADHGIARAEGHFVHAMLAGGAGLAEAGLHAGHVLQLQHHVLEDVAGPGAAMQALDEAAALADAAAVLDQAGQPGCQALRETRQFVRGEVFQLADVEPGLDDRTVGPDVRAAQMGHTEKLDVVLFRHVSMSCRRCLHDYHDGVAYVFLPVRYRTESPCCARCCGAPCYILAGLFPIRHRFPGGRATVITPPAKNISTFYVNR